MKKQIIDVVSPSSSASSQEIKKSFTILKQMGFKPRFIGPKKQSLFFAQKDAHLYFKKALLSKDSSIIWAMRGGYGSQRIISQLTKIKPPFQKLFIGHSDTTVIHDWIHNHLSWPTLHFPCLASIPSLSASSLKKFKNISQKTIQFSSLKILNKKTSRTIQGQITGGNMTLIQSSIKTPAFVSRSNQILFLEDVHVKPYEVHRALWQMSEAKVFHKVRAVVFGKWTQYQNTIIKEVLKPWAQSQKFPVFVGLTCGHGKTNDPLPLGVMAKISSHKKDFKLTTTLKSSALVTN